jgi:outer membrane usher protein FimD/PapC
MTITREAMKTALPVAFGQLLSKVVRRATGSAHNAQCGFNWNTVEPDGSRVGGVLRKSRIRFLGGMMSLAGTALGAGDIEFNTDVLDLSDRSNIDLSRFTRSGFIFPGTYSMVVRINTHLIAEHSLTFYSSDDGPEGSQACLSQELVEKLGINKNSTGKLHWWKDGQCLDTRSLPGMEVSADLATATLNIRLPQAYLEYSASNWDPPSRWDDGVPGLLIDYNMTAQFNDSRYDGTRKDLRGNGTVGANAGAWRLRADWQGRVEKERESATNRQKLEWSRYYVYRAITSLNARMVAGEDYLYSDLFDSFRFTGAGLKSDESQLPPNLRGYAPEIAGIAKTNAKVIISQQGRVLYETLVAAGPFRIRDLNDAVSGMLDVRVEEQDGSEHKFVVYTAGVPYLTRPGQVRYKLSAGQPSSLEYRGDGAFFATGEFSWGISNGWSLLGGAIFDNNYRAASTGVGRDLLAFGAISVDVTESWAHFWGETLSGKSYRLQYSKNFEEFDSKVTFAGHRFSEKTFLSMNQYLDAKHYRMNSKGGGQFLYENTKDYIEHWSPIGGGKTMYTVTVNKQIRDLGTTFYVSYYKQTYWNRQQAQRWNLSASFYLSIGNVKNMNMSLNAYRSQEYHNKDNGMSLTVSLPLGHSGTFSLDADRVSGDNSFSARFNDRIDERNNYQLSASDSSVSGYLSNIGDNVDIDMSASAQQSKNRTLSASVSGGGTLTRYGAAFHRTTSTGGTRLLVNTGGVSDVPVRGYGTPTRSNAFGNAVISNVSSYQRTTASIDVERLPSDVEATQSVTQLTLTEGAIGYRSLDMISGKKTMAVLRLLDGSSPPFGATVKNIKQQVTGMLNDSGSVYLSGVWPGDQMIVSWGEAKHCIFTLPAVLPTDGFTYPLQLRCQSVRTAHSLPEPAALTGQHNNMESTSL